MMQANPVPTNGDAPPWLVEFLMHPPLWFKGLLFAAAGLTIVLALRRVYSRDLYISIEEQREMLLIVGTVEGIAVGVIASMGILSLGFVGDSAVGLVSGFAVVEVLRRVDPLLPGALRDDAAQVATGWAVVAFGAFILPELVAIGQTPVPGGLDLALGGIGSAMFLWTVMQEFGPGETLGELARASE